MGANVIVAKDFGSKNVRDIQSSVHTSMLVSIISGIFLSIVGVFLSKYFLIWMGTPDEILPLATEYLQFYFSGMLFTMVYNFGAAILRAIGDTRRPLHFLMISGAVNVVLNLIFVILFKMDVAGVGLATAISQVVAAVLIVISLMKEKSDVKLDFKKLHINRTKFIQILKIGVPAGLQGCLFSLSNVVIQSSVNSFGNDVVAGNSAAQSIEGFIYISMNAFAQASTTFCSQAFGAKDLAKVKKVLLLCLTYVFILGLVLGGLASIFASPLIRLYTTSDLSPKILSTGRTRLIIIASTYALCGMMEVMVGSLRGIGKSFLPMIVSLLGACGLRLLWLATVFQIPKMHTLETIYLSYPVSWLVTTLIHVICFVLEFKKIRFSVENEPPP